MQNKENDSKRFDKKGRTHGVILLFSKAIKIHITSSHRIST